MGRLPDDASPEAIDMYHGATDGIWSIALDVLATEVAHNLKCAQPDCAGAIRPWIAGTITDVPTARVLIAVLMERLADMISGAQLLGDTPGGDTP